MLTKASLCAHRGDNICAPENTLPAFSLALGRAAEIELDVWASKDGELFICHDRRVDRTTNGHGYIADMTAAQLKALDAGAWFSKDFEGVRLPTLSEALALIKGKAAVNLHIKSDVRDAGLGDRVAGRRNEYGAKYDARPIFKAPYFVEKGEVLKELESRKVTPYSEAAFQRILLAIDALSMRSSVYVTGKADVLITAKKLAPDIERCALEGDENYTLAQNAIQYDCQKAQFCKLYLTREELSLAREHGIHANLFWADDKEEAEAYVSLGIDTILTNHILAF